jgi:hypothetical protein
MCWWTELVSTGDRQSVVLDAIEDRPDEAVLNGYGVARK